MVRKRTTIILILACGLIWMALQFLSIHLMPMENPTPSASLGKCEELLTECRAPRAFSVNSSSTAIYVITPTYSRPVQKAELTRMLHTFLHVANLHWIVVEDAASKTILVANFLAKSRISHTHLHIPTPAKMKLNLTRGEKKWSKPRGVWQRNEGLRWLRESTNVPLNQSSNQPINAVLYFADDDNTYDLELFDEIRTVRMLGVWPVAFVGELLVEKPRVEGGKVTGWDVAYKPDRPFAVDMAGFAVNLRLILAYPMAKFNEYQPVGYQETFFLRGMKLSMSDVEAKASNCTRVLVWHTRTEPVNVIQERRWNLHGKRSDEGIEF